MGETAMPFQSAEAAAPRRADSPPCALSVSVFADRDYLRAEISEDIVSAGLRLAHCGTFAELTHLVTHERGAGLGDVVLVDCPVAEAAELAMLAHTDMHTARAGTQLIVSTSIGSLDGVFGCLDQSDAQINIGSVRAERLIALGRAIARAAGDARAREMNDVDRTTLLRLTEQVARIADRFDQLVPGGGPGNGDEEPGRLEAPAMAFHAGHEDRAGRLSRAARPALPDPRVVRRIIRQRQARMRYFKGNLFADPAWDMLLDLTAAEGECAQVSVSSLCIASAVPPTTALRWIGVLTDAGLLRRVEDPVDRRRVFLKLTDKAVDAIARYFVEIGEGPMGGL